MRRQRDKLISAADEEDVEADEQGTGIELGQGRKRPAEIALASGVDSMDLLPEQARGVLHVFPLGPAIRQIRIQQHADHGGLWSQFVQQFKSLRRQVSEVQAHPCCVTARSVEANQANRDRDRKSTRLNSSH